MLGTAHPRRTALLLTLITVVMGGGMFALDYTRHPALVLGPMVQQVTADGFALFWQAHPDKAAKAILRLEGAVVQEGLLTAQGEGRYIASFADLEPGRAYEYELVCGKTSLARHSVRTAPASPEPFRFLAFGDSGTGGFWQQQLATRMPAYRPDLIVHTGDIIYPRGRVEDNYRKFFMPYAPLLAGVPIYVALGNHEYKLEGVCPVADAFVFPPNGPAGHPPERHYWFDYADARFAIVDSNNDYPHFRDMVAPWLDSVLADAGDRWKIVVFHEPVHTQGKYTPADKLLKTIVPVIERHGVELVLCGHNHMYERTHAVRDGRVVPDGQGTVYVTTGAGGANLAEARPPMPETIAAWNDRRHSFTVADVSAETILLRQIDVWGTQIDECRVLRRTPRIDATTKAAP